MTDKDIEALKELINYCDYRISAPENITSKEVKEKAHKRKQALTHLITLAKKVQNVKGVLPKEMRRPTSKKLEELKGQPDLAFRLGQFYSHNACRSETAIRLIAFRERLEKILSSISVGNQDDDSRAPIPSWLIKPIAKAVSQELGIKE